MLDKNFYNDTYKLFVQVFGEESEYRMCIEEMSELTKELCKFMRYSHEEDNAENQEKLNQIKKNIIEECADVSNCIGQIKRIFGEAEVEEVMDYKIQRGREVALKAMKKKNKNS